MHLRPTAILFLALFSISCTTSVYRPAQELPPERVEHSTPGISIRDGHVWAPWEIGRLTTNPQLLEAEADFERGDLTQAESIYRALESATDEALAEEAFLQHMSFLLKQGRSRELLSQASTHLQSKGKTINEASPRLALMVAYGYQYSGERDQALAWLSLANRQSGRAGELSVRITNSAAELVRSIADEEFENSALRWTSDQFVTALYSGERLRRASGGKAQSRDISSWFSPSTYKRVVPNSLPPVSGEVVGAATPQAGGQLPATASKQSNTLTIGVILPFTGEYADVGDQVKHGIMLGSLQSGGAAKFIYGDTSGNSQTAVSEYDRLVLDGAQVLLGPILLKTSETVALRSQQVGVPFITFTKRNGIPDLGPTVFRLGVTTDDQVEALIKTTHEMRNLNSFAALIPRNETGLEYLESFQRKLTEVGLPLATSAEYTPGDRQSVELALSRIADKPAQALFLPDNLENLAPVFELLRGSALNTAVLMGPAAWNDPAALRAFGSNLEGALIVTPFWAESPDPEVQSFVAGYRQQFNREPDVLGAQSFDATRLILQTVNQPPFSAARIIELLQAADSPFKGVTGTLRIQPNGEISREMEVLQVQGGRLQKMISPTGDLVPPAQYQQPQQ